MEYLKSLTQTKPFQWTINKVRENTYPYYYGKGSWEADHITDNIWLGSLASAYDREALKSRNITRIITAAYDINPVFNKDTEIIYLTIPVIDDPSEEIAKHFDKAVDFINESLAAGRGVLVHCIFGISRSSTLLCAYLIKKRGMSLINAIEFVKSKRQKANPNEGFLKQLLKYENLPLVLNKYEDCQTPFFLIGIEEPTQLYRSNASL